MHVRHPNSAILPSRLAAMSDFSVIPSIEQLRQRPVVRALDARYGGEAVVEALRTSAAEMRRRISRGDAAIMDASVVEWIESDTAARLDTAFRPSLTPVINASGVVIHTNLGRAPLSRAVLVERCGQTAGSL